ncbi:unnamed protein product [Trifolium pratense]|uniref:Uncharacterized protein n=1 Tax=Trifolium pratense TaxID=57577 RepID=A0ACB0I6E5_TRIPR|nr:unnamed protein product [Trifolium pratense]
MHEKKLYAIEEPQPNPEDEPAANAPKAQRDAYQKRLDDAMDAKCLMLATMTSELQKQHEDMNAFDMIEHLKTLYQEQARIERFEVSKALFSAKLSEGSLVSPHVLKMIGYVGNLEKLGFPLENELAADLILQSLPESFNQFVLNFTMSDMEKTLPQLLGMLRQAEQNMKTKGKSNHVLMIWQWKQREGQQREGRQREGQGSCQTQTYP